ncbi:TonB family protein [Hymenobacter sp. 15J16-1T3B]|uniref:energy transducer TonB n=1 Tax=Hymenobacter sp. 15J16-1T3B TaxID=2886941 RepID=UPI001D12FFC5|nr:energy transducer TonB [Hymenobacter sp. 15J16-1T3B]MCC3158979.1 TonB family protein [Hymenobacter sp. 15J16-1T3B]
MKLLLLLAGGLLGAAAARAQAPAAPSCLPDSLVRFLDAEMLPAAPAQAQYTRVLVPPAGAGSPVVNRLYFPDGQLYSEVTFAAPDRRVQQGPVRTYYPGGQLRMTYQADDDIIDGYLRTYYPDGQLKRNDLYDHGRLIKGQYFTPDGQPVEPHVPFRQDPAYPGGNAALVSYLQAHLTYPKALTDVGDGQVLVAFTVTARGNVADVRVKSGVSPELDAAALAAVRTLPAFEPGRLDGERTALPMLVPITFKAPGVIKAMRQLGL